MTKRFRFETDFVSFESYLETFDAFDFTEVLSLALSLTLPTIIEQAFAKPPSFPSGPARANAPESAFELSSLLATNGGDGSSGFVISGIDVEDNSGRSVSSAGDINGDGFDDIIIGARDADRNPASPDPAEFNHGESYVVFGSDLGFDANIDLSTLNGANGFVIHGLDSGDRSGQAVSNAGDINGDGFDDIIIGAHYADPNSQASGESYLIFGNSDGFGANFDLTTLNGSNGFVINGIDELDISGWSVSSAGDMNGDGFDDVLIGARHADPNGNSNAGESFVVFGKDSGWSAGFDLSTLNGTNGFVVNGVAASDSSGYSVSSAGDVNGDGFDDIVIGARWANSDGSNFRGESYVVFGQQTGFTASLNLSTLNGAIGFVLEAMDGRNYSGHSVSSAGDFNGDGFDDIIIGAPGTNTNGNSNSGASYVVFGSNASFAPRVELATLNGSNGFVLNGIDSSDESGVSVSAAGDLNGDGFDDILIGAYGGDSITAPNGNSDHGETYVVFGRKNGLGASFDLSTLNGNNGFVINGVDRNDQSGFAVSAAGDINGDGLDDIIIGAYGADPNGNDSAGESYIVFGRGDFGRSSEILTANDDDYTASHLGEAVYALAGNDIINGSVGSDALHGDEGNDVLRAAGGNDYVAGGEGDDTILGNAGEDNLFGGNGNDLIIGGGGNDTINGDSGEDQLSGQGGDDVINGGDGVDTILGGSGADDISGGGESDIINAGGGNDTVVGEEGNDDVSGGAGSDVIFGGAGSDNIYGNNQNDELFGGDGLDVLEGGAGNDFLDGGADVDVLYGGASQDTLLGGAGGDVLFGNGGGDSLDGGDGNDTLDGGGGNDTLTGGSGRDFFTQNSGFRTDRITDFENGIDVISFSDNSSANSFADVMAAALQQGTAVRIELNPNNILILENFDLADLDASDFIF